ncbi:MAG: hypothetical protein KAT65_23215 [Methanophagales archaeon]|nr:hypothetical protein [Methanophagales archaeon]
MEIDEQFKNILVEEFRLVASKIREESDTRRKNFFFSAAHGVVFRSININFDPELVVIHNVLNSTYTLLYSLQTSIDSGNEKIIQIPLLLFDKLADLLDELAGAIQESQNTYEIIQKIAILSYMLTGNGYYLYQKGIIEV